MLMQVKNWNPPTADHEGLKKFMIEQLQEGIKSDCRYTPDAPQRLTGAEYKQQLIEETQRSIEYYTTNIVEEVTRAKEKTKWVRALHENLLHIDTE